MKIKVITSYKPGTWESYAKKGIESMAQQFPKEIDIVVYAEEPKPHCDHERITWVDLNSAEPELFKFKNKHKNEVNLHHQKLVLGITTRFNFACLQVFFSSSITVFD